MGSRSRKGEFYDPVANWAGRGFRQELQPVQIFRERSSRGSFVHGNTCICLCRPNVSERNADGDTFGARTDCSTKRSDGFQVGSVHGSAGDANARYRSGSGRCTGSTGGSHASTKSGDTKTANNRRCSGTLFEAGGRTGENGIDSRQDRDGTVFGAT